MNDIDVIPLITLVENNWQEFMDYAGNEEKAEEILDKLKDEAGMSY